MEECIFCKIAQKEIPAAIIYEDKHTLAFLDIHPRAPGHTMVILKNHVPDLLSMERVDLQSLFSTVQRVVKKINQALYPDGFTYGINQGRASGQEVNHLHIHILPRFYGDGGGSVQSIINNPSQEDIESIAEKIKNVNI